MSMALYFSHHQLSSKHSFKNNCFFFLLLEDGAGGGRVDFEMSTQKDSVAAKTEQSAPGGQLL